MAAGGRVAFRLRFSRSCDRQASVATDSLLSWRYTATPGGGGRVRRGSRGLGRRLTRWPARCRGGVAASINGAARYDVRHEGDVSSLRHQRAGPAAGIGVARVRSIGLAREEDGASASVAGWGRRRPAARHCRGGGRWSMRAPLQGPRQHGRASPLRGPTERTRRRGAGARPDGTFGGGLRRRPAVGGAEAKGGRGAHCPKAGRRRDQVLVAGGDLASALRRDGAGAARSSRRGGREPRGQGRRGGGLEQRAQKEEIEAG